MELSLDELELVLQTLVFDGKLEIISANALQLLAKSGMNTNDKYYKLSKPITTYNYLTDSPCGVCPVAAQCYDDGIISPKTCKYLSSWLSMPDDDLF